MAAWLLFCPLYYVVGLFSCKSVPLSNIPFLKYSEAKKYKFIRRKLGYNCGRRCQFTTRQKKSFLLFLAFNEIKLPSFSFDFLCTFFSVKPLWGDRYKTFFLSFQDGFRHSCRDRGCYPWPDRLVRLPVLQEEAAQGQGGGREARGWGGTHWQRGS